MPLPGSAVARQAYHACHSSSLLSVPKLAPCEREAQTSNMPCHAVLRPRHARFVTVRQLDHFLQPQGLIIIRTQSTLLGPGRGWGSGGGWAEGEFPGVRGYLGGEIPAWVRHAALGPSNVRPPRLLFHVRTTLQTRRSRTHSQEPF